MGDITRGKSKKETTDIIYDYSVSHTFYRKNRIIQNILEDTGFGVKFVTIDNPKLDNYKLIKRMIRFGPIKRMVNWMLLNFITVEILVTKM